LKYAIRLGTNFGPSANGRIEDEVNGTILNTTSKEELSSFVASYLSITFSEVVNTVKEITFDDFYYHHLWELISEYKNDLYSQGKKYWEVNAEVQRRRFELMNKLNRQLQDSKHYRD